MWLLEAMKALGNNSVDTSNQDRVIRQYVEREARGEPQPAGGPWFAPSFIEQWKKENQR